MVTEMIPGRVTAYGTSTPAERDAMVAARYRWALLERAADESRDRNATAVLHRVSHARTVVDAYASGWVDGKGLSGEAWERALSLLLCFADEYTHNEWLFRTGQINGHGAYGVEWKRLVAEHFGEAE